MKFSELVFKFFDEFFLLEAAGEEFNASSKCKTDRWELCEKCEYFDEPEEGCKKCGCYLPSRIQDPWAECPLDKWVSNGEEWNNSHYEKVKQTIIEKYPDYETIISEYETQG